MMWSYHSKNTRFKRYISRIDNLDTKANLYVEKDTYKYCSKYMGAYY